MTSTPFYQALWAYQLTLRQHPSSAEELGATIASARVDLKPYQSLHTNGRLGVPERTSLTVLLEAKMISPTRYVQESGFAVGRRGT